MASVHDYPFVVNNDNQNVNRVTSAKFWGVHIDDQLTWEHHITCISPKLAKKYWHNFPNTAPPT